jgi:hypothetical protein
VEGYTLSGFVKLRRGIIEHIPKRLSPDEALTYILIIALADHRNGTWKGSSQALSANTGWSVRQCQCILKSLRGKGYISGECKRGIGSYPIKVHKYFEEAHGDAQLPQRSAPVCVTRPKEAHGDATLQEVSTYKNKREEEKPAQNSRGYIPVHFKKQTAKEMEAIMQIESPEGPRKDYLEFIEYRNAGKIPKGMNWEKWKKLSLEERQKLLRAA